KAQPDDDIPVHRPNRMARMMFRQQAAQSARHDTEQLARGGLSARVGLLSAALRFTLGIGQVPEMAQSASVVKVFDSAGGIAADGDRQDAETGGITEWRTVRFADAESPFDGRQREFDELWQRYFLVKIQGIHFCGPAHYDTPLLDGFRCLSLVYPMVMWLARVRAVRYGRDRLELSDVQASLATVDHNFGYSPALGTRSALNRVALLSRMQQLMRLVGWYSR
ncbi:MAG: hypothetical protein KDA89_01115, partial [Planctomycetaceae bacterium]|nr:hypothetical protein [Planctomycetaceae bacterium]